MEKLHSAVYMGRERVLAVPLTESVCIHQTHKLSGTPICPLGFYGGFTT